MHIFRGLMGVTAGIAILTLAGCASAPTPADSMRGHAVEAQGQVDLQNRLAQDWDKAEKLIASGNREVKDGLARVKAAEKNLQEGNAQIERGNLEVAEGNRLMRDSTRLFREAFPGLDIKP